MKTATPPALLCLLLAGCLSSKSPPQPVAAAAIGLARTRPAVDIPGPQELAALREKGPAGLKELLDRNTDLIDEMSWVQMPLDDERAVRLRAAVDAVAMQRDAFMSRLYWYSDLEAAKAEAKRTKRHILSLRLLGKLNEEYSCANSRFFRIVLYADPEVADYLREHYVLHWKSVRPAPLVTIDMGDGRRLKRTITGNSIHYVLDSDGTVLDALPGLYGPASFLAALARSENLWSPDAATMRQWHGRQADALCRQWLGSAVQCGLYGQVFSSRMNRGVERDVEDCLAEAFPDRHMPPISATQQKAVLGDPPTLYSGLPVAKSMVERPLVQQIAPGSAAASAVQRSATPAPTTSPSDWDKRPLAARMNAEAWKKLGMLRRDEARLHQASRVLMIKKGTWFTPHASEKQMIEQVGAFMGMENNFQDAIAQDTVRNEYALHAEIHQWLERDASDSLRHDVEALNKRVYAELFGTPDYDEWLGLVPADTYSGLEKDGCACDTGAPSMK